MIDQTQFDQFRRDYGGKDPLVKRVRLSDLEISDTSIQSGTIHIGGIRVPVSEKFFARLAQMVNINPALIVKMHKNADAEIQIKLLKAVKEYSQTREADKEFYLIGDPETQTVTNIIPANNYSRITNDSLFATAETLMNEFPGLSIDTIDFSSNRDLRINMINGDERTFGKIGADESFKFGISLANLGNGSRIDEFYLRLSCANGNTIQHGGPGGIDSGGSGGGGTKLGPTQGDFAKLLDKMKEWNNTGFVPTNFQDRLEAATTVRASMAEMKGAIDRIAWSINEPDAEMKARLLLSMKDTHFPAYDAAVKRLARAGYVAENLTKQQLKFVKTDSSVWDLVNELTWIGSHSTAVDIRDRAAFKVIGGDLMHKNWDLANAELAGI